VAASQLLLHAYQTGHTPGRLAGARQRRATAAATLAAPAAVPYGHNEAAGKTFTHDGVTLYYEV